MFIEHLRSSHSLRMPRCYQLNSTTDSCFSYGIIYLTMFARSDRPFRGPLIPLASRAYDLLKFRNEALVMSMWEYILELGGTLGRSVPRLPATRTSQKHQHGVCGGRAVFHLIRYYSLDSTAPKTLFSVASGSATMLLLRQQTNRSGLTTTQPESFTSLTIAQLKYTSSQSNR